MEKPRILFSVPTMHHVEIAIDEMRGMQELGFPCDSFAYAAQQGVKSAPARLYVIIKNAFKLVKKAHRFKPDIIYFNSRLENIAGLRDYITIRVFKIGYRQKVKFVIKSHGSDIDVLTNGSFLMRSVILPFLKRNISGWLFLSHEEKQKVLQLNYFNPDTIFTTKNVVRTDQFIPDDSFRNKYSIDPKSKILLFVGRIIREKGIFEVIEAFAKIKDEARSTLIIVGDGSEHENVKQQIELSGIKERVILTGFLPEHEVIPFYANSDILIFPTYFPEGFPMALFNSVAAGLAILTTKTRAATDYLTQPENCIWVEGKNSCSVYSALSVIIHNEILINSMKIENKLKAKLFSQKQISQELANIIDIILVQ